MSEKAINKIMENMLFVDVRYARKAWISDARDSCRNKSYMNMSLSQGLNMFVCLSKFRS